MYCNGIPHVPYALTLIAASRRPQVIFNTTDLLQSPPSSPPALSPPPRLLSSTSSVLEFSSSLSSLEGINQPEESNRDVSVYLQVPRTILVSRRMIVEDGKFNLSPFLLREAWAG